jgi:hypothetical protein
MKRMLIVLTVVIAALMSVGIAAAQEPGAGQPGGQPRNDHPILNELIRLVAEETGLAPMDILRQARDGKTLAQIITENGGSVENVQARIDEAVANFLNTPLNELQRPDRRDALPREAMLLVQEIAELANVDVRDVAEQLIEGSTLNEVISAYGLDASTVIANAEAAVSDRVNEQLATLDLEALLDVNFRERALDAVIRRAVTDATADALGKNPREILRELTEGQTLNDYITANGGDPASITAAALEKIQMGVDRRVENGGMTPEEADEVLASAEAKITELLSQPFELPLRDPAN